MKSMYPCLSQVSHVMLLMVMTLCGCSKDDSGTSPGEGSTRRMLGAAIHYSTNSMRVGKTRIGDLNGDGRGDIVTVESSGYGRHILIYYQNSSGGLNPPVETFAENIRGVAVGDVNGDSRNDLVISGIGSPPSGPLGRLYVYYQSPAGELLAPIEDTLLTNSPGDLAIGDLNADHRDDIAVLGGWEMDPGRGNIFLFFQNTDGSLGDPFTYNQSPVVITGEIQITDMSSDGRMDIVFQSDLLQLAVLRQLSPGAFATHPDYHTVHTSYWGTFYAFATGDVNGDDRNDVVVFDPGNNGLMNIFLQDAGGMLSPPLLDSVATGPYYGVEIADIDYDGLDDILGDVVAPGYPTGIGMIDVFFQTPTHIFGQPVTYVFETSSGGGSGEHNSLAVGDVTGDGYVDAVVTWADEGLWVLPSIRKP